MAPRIRVGGSVNADGSRLATHRDLDAGRVGARRIDSANLGGSIPSAASRSIHLIVPRVPLPL